MVSLWPFGGGRVKDVKAPEISEAAIKALHQYGRSPVALRLLYRALQLDPQNPRLLLILSEVFHARNKHTRPVGDEIFSGIIIEYAMDPKTLIAKDQRPAFDKARADVMVSWGFASKRGNEMDLDHIGYMAFINQLMGQVQSVRNGFLMALNKVGVQAGAIDPAKGKNTPGYDEWLRSSSSSLRF